MAMINYAHRGASEYFPENTLRAFYAGLEMGATGIETDIQRTLDGQLVLFHDDTLNRIIGDKRRIAECTYQELLDMDFGAYKGLRFSGERIVLLDTFLTHFSKRGLQLALEIKQPGVEERSLSCITAHKCSEEVTFTSFLWESLLEIRRLDRHIALGFLTGEITEDIIQRLLAIHASQICPRIDLVTPEAMGLAQQSGLSVRFWGIRNEADMLRALSLGGDGMTCNFPDKLTAEIQH